MLLLKVSCLYFVQIVVSFPEREALHEHMTEPELAYIFSANGISDVPEYEVVYLPAFRVEEALGEHEAETSISYGFTAFGRQINLELLPNKNLIPRVHKTYFWEDGEAPLEIDYPKSQCYYLHKNYKSSAAINTCQEDTLEGLLFLENSTIEIHPVPKRLFHQLKTRETNPRGKYPHIISRAALSSAADLSGAVNLPEKYRTLVEASAAEIKRVSRLTVEVALFFDETGYKIFAPYFDYDRERIRDMLLAYMNGVQALYHHPSLGTNLDIALVRLDIMKVQPPKMPHYDGERSKLLDSFCDYQNSLNIDDDSDPDHWDMALYVSGLDFFHYENGKKSGVTMGLATVGGVCLERYNCIIAELGTTNVYGKPYPSAGFTSVFILAHEMGHNFGMHHDSSGNSCPKEGYIMSPSRGTNGETQWSSCSAEVMTKLGSAKCLTDLPKRNEKDLDHSKFLNAPGQTYTAKKQCEILLRDKDAIALRSQKQDKICQNLHCKTPNRSGFYFAGPALDGTTCGKKKYCFGGQCVSKAPPKPVKIIPGGWSHWKEGACESGCIEKSKGHQTKRRLCNNPTPVNTDLGCDGPSYKVALCEDNNVCPGSKVSAVSYASSKCKEFSKLVAELDAEGVGLQAPHEEGRLWMGCAIFCKRSDSGTFFTPRIELNDLGVSAYFPDGTWCHADANVNYYCLHHHCLPENFQMAKGYYNTGDDLDIPQNAKPSGDVDPELKMYFSLDANGKPFQNNLKPPTHLQNEEQWETKDYIELPEDKVFDFI